MSAGRHWRMLGLILLGCLWAGQLFAGGSGLNTIVVINQASSNSCELGNYYCQWRQVPPQNVLYINWPGGNGLWSSNDLQTNLVVPLQNMLANKGLTNQIQYLVLSMDIPFQTMDGSAVNSTTAALFYGLRVGDGSDPWGTTNSYAGSEAIFNPNTTVGSPGYSFLATMITGNSLAQAEQVVSQGVAGDGTFSQQPVILAKSSDLLRNLRYIYFDNAIFNINLLGVSEIFRTNTDAVSSPNGCLGYETGLANYSVPPAQFVPGSIADSLTSFGGNIFGPNYQTNLFALTSAGAAGSYGTVAEPENDTQKFPNPQVYFYQARGFSLAESYYQSVNVPYLGLIVGEPLAAPFAHSGSGQWSTNLPNAVLSSTTNLSIAFNAHDSSRPLQQIDLFVDGAYFSTLTNLAPNPGNQLTATLNGFPITYTVPINATLSAIASGLGAAINAATTSTQVKALVYGDQITLECTATNPALAPYYVPYTVPTNAPGLSYVVSTLPATSQPQVTAGSVNKKGAYTMQVGIPSTLPYVVLASTNLFDWQPILTNNVPGLLNFTDPYSTNYSRRFYRFSWPMPNQPPQLSTSASSSTGPGASAFDLHVAGTAGQSWIVQTSTDLLNWASVFTNSSGGTMDYLDTGVTNTPSRFYRTVLATTPTPSWSVYDMASNLFFVRVNGATLPYEVGITTNSGQWILQTNFAIGQIQSSVASAPGSSTLSTFLGAAQPVFMSSQATGYQGYTVISNSLPTNAWIKYTFTLTNGQAVVVNVTNQAGLDSITLAGQIVNAINTNPALQGSNGVYADDFVPTPTAVSFNLYARSPGFAAAQISVRSQAYFKVIMTTTAGPLTQNLSDLEPRNQLYITAGASRLAVTFPLATKNLSDGYHQLTAVAYEGSNVRTETQVTVPVRIQNSPLSASLSLLDLTSPAPAQGTYHLQVTANTNNVSLITLYSRGGPIGTAANVSTATFPVAGTNFWAGQIPFYAIVQTASGLSYRTQTQTVTLY